MSLSLYIMRILFATLAAAAWLVASGAPADAVSFRPDVLERVRAEGRLPAMVASQSDAITRGLNRPPSLASGWLRQGDGDRAIPDRNAIVILVDFSDNPADQITYPSSHYSEMLFSVGTYPTGSMRDWYIENSYGTFDVTGAVTVWLRMPQIYAYYVDHQAGFGSYPNNAQKLAEDAVAAADASVDFSLYDNDGPDGIPDSGDDDGYVDALFVVHAGPGRETTGSDDDIHSHAWAMANPVSADGVIAWGYSMEPEDGQRGVFGHEFGHVLGLPDLYDTDYSSAGVGDWCMMSFGSWGGGGLTPVHFLSWCKARLGFLDPVAPLVNATATAIPRVEDSPTAYKLWTGGYPGRQYFTVENRQRVGSDVSLPGEGLIICHIDEEVGGNSDEDHPLVAVEQADGLNELANGGGSDTGDPWPGSTVNRNFTNTSTPNSRDYAGSPTQVAVRAISNSLPTMTADLEVESSPILIFERFEIDEVTGNADGDIDPGETWDMPVTIFNRGAPASNVTGTVACLDLDVTILSGATSFGAVAGETEATGSPAFRLRLGAGSTDDGLPCTVTIDDHMGGISQRAFIVGVNDSLDFYAWSHGNVTTGYGDQWHISNQRNHTPGGRYAWKCGSTSGGNYADYLDAALNIRPLPLASVDAIRFWHWIDAEDDANNTAWDGGIIEASVDGGAWVQLTPDGGYPYTIISNPASPFPGGTPCFSGTYDWSEVRVDLAGLTGESVRIRLRFGSDGYVTGAGWFIDDVSVEGSLTADVSESEAISALWLSPPRPNPSGDRASIGFRQPAGSPAEVRIVDVGGRLIRQWSFPAGSSNGGTREVVWDGRAGDGSRASSGVYFVRLRIGEETLTRPLMRIR